MDEWLDGCKHVNVYVFNISRVGYSNNAENTDLDKVKIPLPLLEETYFAHKEGTL